MKQTMLAGLMPLFVLAASDANAGVLTCDLFKTRLNQILQVPAAQKTAPLSFTFVQNSVASSKRYAWTGGDGLSGWLTCGPQDAFADFYMAADPARRPAFNGPDDLTDFSTLGAASVCALADGTPEACRAMVASMTHDAFDQYKDDIKAHDDRPQSLQDYDFAPGLDAVFMVTPSAISWAIGPGVFETVDAARQTLAPKDKEEEDDDDD